MRPCDGSSCVVLVIDDERDVLDVLRDVLESGGYRVISAAGAFEALGYLAATSVPPCLVLLDCMMPEMSGLDLLEVLRARHPRLPVALMSAANMEHLPARACAFLRKPFALATLLRLVALRRSCGQHLERAGEQAG
jgi:CheY-like chemotaxis protein